MLAKLVKGKEKDDQEDQKKNCYRFYIAYSLQNITGNILHYCYHNVFALIVTFLFYRNYGLGVSVCLFVHRARTVYKETQ